MRSKWYIFAMAAGSALVALLWVALFITLAFTAGHFIHKFW